MAGAVVRGVRAGLVGTAVLDAVTYVDAALRGRPASDAPAATVEALLSRMGTGVRGNRRQRRARRTALGALGGVATGTGVAVAASLARASGLRAPGPVAAVLVGGAAMAATDVPMALLGVSDPRTWTWEDWVTDAVPHLAYGVAVTSVVHADVEPEARRPVLVRASPGLVVRSFLLGVAAGSRSSLGVALPALTSRPGASAGRGRRLSQALSKAGALVAVGGEVVADKLPTTPSRVVPPVLGPRLASGGLGGFALARRQHATTGLPVTAGVLGAAAGSYAGAAWRAWGDRALPGATAALLEDSAAAGLAALACRGSSVRGAAVRPRAS